MLRVQIILKNQKTMLLPQNRIFCIAHIKIRSINVLHFLYALVSICTNINIIYNTTVIQNLNNNWAHLPLLQFLPQAC